jgi:Zn-finger nucleic acid-binding protein
MKCPVCHEVRMKEVDKNGIHIDVCPDCKGVWLDRGELEKLLKDVQELRQQYDSPAPQNAPTYSEPTNEYRNEPKYDPRYDNKQDPRYDNKHDPRYNNQYDPRYDSKHPKYKKKKSMFDVFEDIF